MKASYQLTERMPSKMNGVLYLFCSREGNAFLFSCEHDWHDWHGCQRIKSHIRQKDDRLSAAATTVYTRNFCAKHHLA